MDTNRNLALCLAACLFLTLFTVAAAQAQSTENADETSPTPTPTPSSPYTAPPSWLLVLLAFGSVALIAIIVSAAQKLRRGFH